MDQMVNTFKFLFYLIGTESYFRFVSTLYVFFWIFVFWVLVGK